MNIFEKLGQSIAVPKTRIKLIKTYKNAQALLDILDNAYVKGEPLIADGLYDELRREMESKWPKLESKIGHKTDDDDVKLPIPMASLTQLYKDSDKLAKALTKKIRLSDKLDGQSIEIVYRDHKPVAAYTRGDAESGKDISHHIKHMNIPKKLSSKNMTVRFEAIIPLKAFKKYLHEDVGGKYRAARNCVAGLTRSFKPLPAEFAYIDFVAFGIIGGKGSDLKQSDQFKLLKKEGFTVVRSFPADTYTQDQLLAHYDERMKKSKYELDGIVCTRNVSPEIPTAQNPKHAFKFKINSDVDAVVVTVKAIEWQASKYGDWRPVVTFDPVEMVGGVTVQKATGHNAWFIMFGQLAKRIKGKLVTPAKKDQKPIGPGAVIKIVRSGKVIPYIQEVISGAARPQMPDTEYRMDGVHAKLAETNTEVQMRLLNSFFSTMGFRDQGPSTAKILVDNGYASIYNLYGISHKRAQILLGTAKGDSLFASITATRDKTDMVTWLTAVAPYYMAGSSTSTFQKVVDAIPDVASIESSYDMVTRISKIAGIKTLAGSIAATIIDALSLAYSVGVSPKISKVEVTSDRLHDIRVAFSGIRDKQLKQDILEAGGAASDSMNSSTNILIVKDPGAGSSKIAKAEQKGIPILTPAQFRAKYLG